MEDMAKTSPKTGCPHCESQFEDNKDGVKAKKAHIYRNHHTCVDFTHKSTSELLGTCSRVSPTADLACWSSSCHFSASTIKKMSTHVRKIHNGGHQVSDRMHKDDIISTTDSPPPTADRNAEFTNTNASSDMNAPTVPVLRATRRHKSAGEAEIGAHPLTDDIDMADIDELDSPPNVPLTVEPNPILNKVHLHIIRVSKDPPADILVCKMCKIGVTSSSAMKHLNAYHPTTPLTKADRTAATQLLNTVAPSLQSKNSAITRPPHGQAPIPGLRIIPAVQCEACHKVVTTEASMKTHWSEKHSSEPGRWQTSSFPVQAQTFFEGHPKYWAVKPQLAGLEVTNPYSMYRTEVSPQIEALKSIAPPSSPAEIPLFHREVAWHKHLEGKISNTSQVAALCSLMKLPTSKRGIAWLGKPLRNVIHTYLKKTKDMGYKLNIGPRMLLMCCPRNPNKNEYWTPVTDDSLINYGTLLHHLVHSIMLTIEKPDVGYKFPLTDGDKIRARKLKTALKEKKDAMDALHDFVKPFFYRRDNITDNMEDYSKWDDVIECFMAVYSLQDDGNFQEVHSVTGMFATIHYHIRAAILYEANRKKHEFGNNIYKAIEHEAMPNLSPGELSPFNAIDDYQRLASSIVQSSASPPNTRVSEDGMSISFGLHTLHISDLRHGVKTLGEELEAELRELSYGLSETFTLPDKIPDDWPDRRRGASWTKNTIFLDDELLVLRRMLEDPTMDLWNIDGGKFTLKTAKVWDVIARLDKFTQKLALYAFLTAGQTPRGTEFTDHKYANSTRPRTVFMSDLDPINHIWLITRRTKTENLLMRESFIPMKCHPRLSSILSRYLILIRPVETHLAYHVKGDTAKHIYSEYLWCQQGRRMTPEDMYKFFPTLMGLYCNFPVHMRDYRQVGVEIARVFLGTEADVMEEGVDAIAAQSGHTQNMARAHYAVEYGHLPTMSRDVMRRFAAAYKKWWAVVGCDPDEPPLLPLDARRRLAFGQIPAPSSLDTSSISQIDLPFLIEAITAKVTANLTATITHEVQQIKHSIKDSVQSSLADVLAAGLAGGRPAAPPKERPGGLQGFSPEAVDTLPLASGSLTHPSEIDRVGQLPRADHDYLLQLLRKHFPNAPHPNFKSQQQEEAVHLAVSRKSNAVVILPTGGGKSLCFTLPPFNQETSFLTVVMIPNKALLGDQLAKAQRADLFCYEWKAGNEDPPEGTQILFVALETIVSRSFQLFYAQNATRIIRMVVDEAHQVLSSANFRQDFRRLKGLALFQVPRIALSASIPLRLQPRFLEEIGFSPSTPIIRAPSTQPQISYHLVRLPKLSCPVTDVAIQIAKGMEKFMESDQIGVIFCGSKNQVNQLRDKFTGCSSHSHMDPLTRAGDERRWLSNEPQSPRWIASTTGLIQGIDAQNVAVVIFVEIPFGLLNVYQGAGRGGRDGRKSWAILLQSKDAFRPPLEDPDDLQCLTEADQWVESEECRRVRFSTMLDGCSVTCSDVHGCHPCDFCDGFSFVAEMILTVTSDIAEDDVDTETIPVDEALDNIDIDQPRLSEAEEHTFDPSPTFFHESAPITPIPSSPVLSSPGSSIPVSANIPTHLAPPISANASLAVLVDTQFYVQQRAEKTRKAELLSNLCALLSDNCCICWAYQNLLKERHRRLFISCRGPAARGYIPNMTNWMDLKHQSRITSDYTYCFRCHLPQEDDFRPPLHPIIGEDDKISCPFEDIIALLVWFVRQDAELWKLACLSFPALTNSMTIAELADWYRLGDGIGSFINGVELVLWFYQRRPG